MSFGTIVLLIIISVIGYLIMAYKRFSSLREGMDTSWSDIDVKLKRRYDLIDTLIDVVKSYKEYDRDMLENIIKVRQIELSAVTMDEKAAAANMLTVALDKIFARAEAYPELKANTNFLKLEEEFSHLDDVIQSARRYYNTIVRAYNFRLESFPDHFIAQRFQYTSREYFEKRK